MGSAKNTYRIIHQWGILGIWIETFVKISALVGNKRGVVYTVLYDVLHIFQSNKAF